MPAPPNLWRLEDVILATGKIVRPESLWSADTDGTGAGSNLTLTIPARVGYYLVLRSVEISVGGTPVALELQITESTSAKDAGLFYDAYLELIVGDQDIQFSPAYQTKNGAAMTFTIINTANNCPVSIHAIVDQIFDRGSS